MKGKDLNRVRISQASAAIILSPNYSQHPESEDESNLMRVVSIKNTCNDAKVIVQLLQLSSQQQLELIPSWDPSSDTSICKSALKLGLMAQICFCPGVSTLLSNLIYTTSDSVGTKTSESDINGESIESSGDNWQVKYMQGECVQTSIAYEHYYSFVQEQTMKSTG